jgi:hypothetical protein
MFGFASRDVARFLCLLAIPFVACGGKSVRLVSENEESAGRNGAGTSSGGASGATSGGAGADAQGGRGASAGTGEAQAGVGNGGVAGGMGRPPAEKLFIPVTNRMDIVHDAKRNRVYVSRAHGVIERYDLGEGRMLEPFKLGVRLRGIDISTDDEILAVADDQYDLDARKMVLHRVDLADGSSRPIFIDPYPDAGDEGVQTVVFTGAAKVLVAMQTTGDTPLRLVDLDSGAVEETLPDVYRNSTLTRSGDGSVVAIAEGNHSGGPFGMYSIATGNYGSSLAEDFLWEVAVSRLGDRIVLPTWQGLVLSDANFKQTKLPGSYERKYAIGAVFSPTRDELYVAWNAGIEVLDAISWQSLGFVDPDQPFELDRESTFENGRMKTSRDGSLLLVSVEAGVAVYTIDSNR